MADWKKMLDSASETLVDGVKAAGEGLEQFADGARKVAGIGVGSIEIVPDRRRYELGDTVRGTVKLTLTEPTAARRLVVRIHATRKRLAVEQLARKSKSGKRQTPTTQHEQIYEYEYALDGEATYTSGEHRFEVDLPAQIDRPIEGGGLLGDALRAVQSAKSMTEGLPRWRLSADLDIPWHRNVSKTIDLAVRESTGDGPDEDDDLEQAFQDLEREARGAPPQPERASSKTVEDLEAEVRARVEAEREAEVRARVEAKAKARREAKAKAEAERAEAEARIEAELEARLRDKAPAIELPDGWIPALDACLERLRDKGYVIIHEHRGRPVDPSLVAKVLARDPDLDAEILEFHGRMDGCQVLVGQPRVAKPGGYEAARAAEAAADGGAITGLGEISFHEDVGPALAAEFCEDTLRSFEIPSLARLLDDRDDARHRDGRGVLFAAVGMSHGSVGDPKRSRWSELLHRCLAQLEGDRV